MSLLLLLLACRDPVNGDLDAVTVSASELVPTVHALDWSGPPGQVFVEYGLGEALDHSTPPTASADGEASVRVLGLKAGRAYTMRAVTLDEEGQRYESGLIEVQVPLAPAELPVIDLLAHDEEITSGFLLTSIIQEDPGQVVILDHEGDVVWWFALGTDYASTSQRLSLDGQAIWAMVGDRNQESDLGGIWRVELDGSAAQQTRAQRAHHDFLELTDGRLAWLAVAEREITIAGEPENIIGDRILAAEPGADEGDHEELFNIFDDYGPPYRGCSHFEEGAYGIEGHDWTHANSLVQLSDGHLLMGLRNQDAILKLDPGTGEVLWQLGGQRSSFTLTEGEPWDHSHFSQGWDDGVIMMDNGNHRDPQLSRVVEYAWDEGAETYEEVWSYSHPDGRYTPALGDAHKMPEGDVLVSWSVEGHVERVTQEGEPRWELYTRAGAHFSRVRWIEDLYDAAASAE